MTWPTFPTATNCRSGTPVTPPSAVGPRDPEHFYIRSHELARKSIGTIPGSLIVLGCSMGNYVPVNAFSPFAIDYTVTGNDLRKLLHQIADDHQMQWYYDGGFKGTYDIKGIDNWSAACGVLIYGLIHNHLNQEALAGYSKADSIGTAKSMLEQIASWLTGPLVIFEGTPVMDNNGAPGITNSQINLVNQEMQTVFGSRADTILIQNSDDFRDSNGALDAQYSHDGLHLNRAGIDIQVAAGRAALATLGLA